MALSQVTRDKIARELEKYPRRRSALLPALRLAQEETGYLGKETLDEVAALVEFDANALAMLTTFYDLLHDQPVGRYVVAVCDGLACRLGGSAELIESLEQKLDVELDGTSVDGNFTLKRMECLAACDTAPCVLVNTEHYAGYVTPENADRLLKLLIDQGTAPFAQGHVDARRIGQNGAINPNGSANGAVNGRNV